MFFAGLAAGFVFVRLQPHRRLLWPLLAAGGIALVLMARLDAGGFAYPTVDRTPLVAGSFAIMIFALAALERGGHLRLDQRLGALGAMSYPFYLFHPSIIFLGNIFIYYHPADRHLVSPPTVFIIVMVASLALSALVTFLFDRPLQRFARRIDIARGAGGAAAR